jgi:hypothetical protein
MVSVPTGDDPGTKILAFYAANATVVVVAQVVGAVALVPLALFALALARRAPDRSSARRIVAALVLAVVAELATNIPPSSSRSPQSRRPPRRTRGRSPAT